MVRRINTKPQQEGQSKGMTQCEKILRHLEDFGEITSLIAMQEYGIMRLASRISDLRKDGIPIQKEMVKGKNRYGERTAYAKYTLVRGGAHADT